MAMYMYICKDLSKVQVLRKNVSTCTSRRSTSENVVSLARPSHCKQGEGQVQWFVHLQTKLCAAIILHHWFSQEPIMTKA